MGQKLGDKAPKIFNVNWFRLDDEGHFIWPGFGDNLRVLEWILKRCEGKVDAEETSIGYVRRPRTSTLRALTSALTRSRASWLWTTPSGRRKPKASRNLQEVRRQAADRAQGSARRPEGPPREISFSLISRRTGPVPPAIETPLAGFTPAGVFCIFFRCLPARYTCGFSTGRALPRGKRGPVRAKREKGATRRAQIRLNR